MEIKFYYLQSGKQDWCDQAKLLYQKKISHFYPFQVLALKSKPLPREKKSIKIEWEANLLLKNIEPKDWVVLFDEKGKAFDNSLAFANKINQIFYAGKRRVVFVIGGAFGVSKKVQERANFKISITGLTLNHHVALIVALEQIYRAICIEKKIPYHNL